MENRAVSPEFPQAASPFWKKDISILLVKLILIWLSWKAFMWFIGEENVPLDQRMVPAISAVWESINDLLRTGLLHTTRFILEVLGYEMDLINNYILRVCCQYGGIAVGNYCLGFQLMYYFTMLVLVSGLPVAKMAFGIIAGLFIIQFLNVVRFVGLLLIDVHANHLMWISHDYLFIILVFGVLLLFYYRLVK